MNDSVPTVEVATRTMSECQQNYQQLYAISDAIMKESFEKDNKLSIAKCHSFIADLELWLEALENRPEIPVLKAALREYQFSILALLQGQYRYSFMSLRLFFELSMASIRFSAHEIEYWLWQAGQQDIKWAALVESDKTATKQTGTKTEKTTSDPETEITSSGNTILSKAFVRAFSNDAFGEEAATYRSIATKVYRECSEFVHGNSHTHTSIPSSLMYSQATLDDWLERADSIKLVVVFALCARHIKFLSPASLRKLEPAITDTLGHVGAVRNYLSLNLAS